MRTLGRPDYLEQRARGQLAAGVPLVAIGLTALAGSAWLMGHVPGTPFWRSLFPLLGLLVAAAGVRALATCWRLRRLCGWAATLGRLPAQLDGRYTLLLHLRVPELRGALEAAPALLVGPHGALVLVVKHLGGSFRLEGDRWWVRTAGGDRPWERSPTWEAGRPLRALRRFLQSRDLGDVPVQAAVVLAAGDVQTIAPSDDHGGAASAAVLSPDEVAPHVQSLASAVDEQRAESVVRALAPFVGR